MVSERQNIKFSDADVVNPDDFIPAGESNPHNVRPFLLHDHGFTVAVVFADCLQDAIDEACDAGKMKRYEITEIDKGAYIDPDTHDFCEDVCFLGNAAIPHDIDTLGAFELTIPKFSFVALYNAI